MQLIVNPEYGDLKGNGNFILDFIDALRAEGFDNVIPTYRISSERDFVFFQSTAQARGYARDLQQLQELGAFIPEGAGRALHYHLSLQY